MAAKYQLITELYRRTGVAVAKNPQAWQGFLSSACRNYKCRFDEQLLIYAQRPDAVAVAKLETWNRQFKRWVNKDSKGIAVFDPKGRRNTLKYYFDVSDTHEGYYGSRPVPIWQMDERYEQAVMERLSDRFGDVESTDLASALMETAKNAVEDNLQDYFSQLKDCTKDSFLEELDDFNIEVFEQIIFTHTIMLVQPLPQNWDGSKWTGMIMATNERDLFLGFGFSDKAVGIDFFNTLVAWNEDKDVNDGNIQLSLVQEDRENYSVHIYPTFERNFVKDNFQLHEKLFDKRENAGKELDVLVTQMCFCKVFPISPTCAYNCLKNNTQNIYIQLFDTSRVKENDPTTYYDVSPMDDRTILFKKITVCQRKDLDKEQNPLEYYNVPKY